MATMAPPGRTLTMLPQPHRLLPQRHDHVRRRLRLLCRRSILIPVTAAASAAVAAAAALALAHQADALGEAVVRVQLPGRELPGLPLHRNSAPAPACNCAPASSTASPTACSTPWSCRGARRLHRDHGDKLLPLGLVQASHPRLVGLGAGVGLGIRLRLRLRLRRGLGLAAAAPAAAGLLLRRERARTAAAAGRSREESTASNSASNRASASAASAPAAAAADSPPRPPPPRPAAPWSSWAGASRSTPSLAPRCHTHGPSPEP